MEIAYLINEAQNKIASIISITFCLLASVVLIYYIRRRYNLSSEIGLITSEELMLQSYQNHRKNLKIKAMLSSFIILIVLVEIVFNLSLSLLAFPIAWKSNSNHSEPQLISDLKRYSFIFRYSYIISYHCHVTTLCLSLEVLWLTYLHCSYKYTIIRWTWYIAIRCVVFVSIYELSAPGFIPEYTNELAVLNNALVVAANLSDFIMYLIHSRRLYTHLKSRVNEARLFKDRVDYRTEKRLCLHYKIATILVTIALFCYSIPRTLLSVTMMLSHYMDILSAQISNIYYFFLVYLNILVDFGYIIYSLILNLNYLYVISMIILIYCRQKLRLTHVNKKIKPLVSKYHDSLHYTKYDHYY